MFSNLGFCPLKGCEKMKTLIITEKPDMSRKFVEALKGGERFQRKGDKNLMYYEGEKHVIANAVGHVYGTKTPKDYDEFKGWKWEAIPFFPPNGSLDYVPSASKKGLVKSLSELFKRKDIECVINACDAAREGDLIFWEIYDQLKSRLPVKRLWTSSLVKESILKAFEDLKGEEFYTNRKQEAYARQFADWALGMNLTIGFTLVANMGRALHIGRVQTPTLAILVQRKQEIDQFVSKDYYGLKVDFGKYEGVWFKNELGNTRIDEKEEVEKLKQLVQGKTGVIEGKEVEKENQKPKFLYNLSQLQSEANKKFGFSANDTLQLAQTLYEKYEFITYPRSSSSHLGTTHIPELPKTLDAIKGEEYKAYKEQIIEWKIPTNKRFVDDSKLNDHHAIIPTIKPQNIELLQNDPQGKKLLQLYDLVVKRFLAVFYPDAEYEKTTIITNIGGETFKTTGKIKINSGWKEVYGDSESKENKEELLPPVNKGEELKVVSAEVQSKKTKAPDHYTEGKLIEIMEDPRRLLQDESLKKILKEREAGLGTVATQSSIIENLKDRKYVEVIGKGKAQYLVATKLAEQLINVAPKELKSPEITADWEQKLLDIQKGKLTRDCFEGEIRNYVEGNLLILKNSEVQQHFQQVRDDLQDSGIKCPKCKGKIKIVSYKKSDLYVCENHTKESPCVRIYETTLGKKISKTQIKQILEKGQTTLVVKGLKSVSGKTYEAKIKLDLEQLKCVPVFDQKTASKSTELQCPFCGGKIVEREKAFGCSNWKEKNCKFTMWKNGKEIDAKLVGKLIKDGKTDVVSLKGPKGTYKVVFVLDKDNKDILREFA